MAYSGPIAFAALLAAFIVSACAGGGTEEAPAPAPAIDFADPAMAVIKVRPSADGVTILEEKPTPITQPGPQRRVALLDPSGRVRGTYEAPAGSSIIDLAQHASGEVTVGLATAKAVTIVRLDRLAHPISQLALPLQ